MFYVMNYEITIGSYKLQTVDKVHIVRSVEQLSDTAQITLPSHVANKQITIDDKLSVGDRVTIKLGYNGELRTEFEGYLNIIQNDADSYVLDCIDGLYHFKVRMVDVQLKQVTLPTLLRRVVQTANAAHKTSYTVACDYTGGYDKFTVYHASGLDVLKKVQEEFKANIYFEGNALHCHAPYSRMKDEKSIILDFAANVETADLKYVKKEDKKLEVEVVSHLPNGKHVKATYGDMGGEKLSLVRDGISKNQIQQIARDEYNIWKYDGYAGTLGLWLVPYVEPTHGVTIRDPEQPSRTGNYYVIATEVTFDNNGGKRVVTVGRRLS